MMVGMLSTFYATDINLFFGVAALDMAIWPTTRSTTSKPSHGGLVFAPQDWVGYADEKNQTTWIECKNTMTREASDLVRKRD